MEFGEFGYDGIKYFSLIIEIWEFGKVDFS